MNDVTEEELAKLKLDENNFKRICSESDEEVDSDDELVMKFVKPKNKTNQFETTAYAFALNNKMSKLKSDSARLDERMRYLQLDYSNSLVKIDEQKACIIHLRSRNSILVKESEKFRNKFTITKYLFLMSVFVNSFLFTAMLVTSNDYPKLQMT